MSATLQHTRLGELKGNEVDGVAQFLGLKYANIKDRLAPAVLNNDHGTAPIDATKYGFVPHANEVYIG